MKKSVVVIKGSPRKHGNSAILADQVAAGARDAGAEVETFFLQGMDIQACTACDACQDGIVDDCVLEDDMAQLYPKLRRADAIVIASPVYWFTMNAQTKLFIDRLYAIVRADRNDLKKKKIGIILTYGDTDPYKAGAINAIHTYQDMFRYIDAELVGTVYGTALHAGEIQKQKSLMEEAYQLGKKLVQ